MPLNVEIKARAEKAQSIRDILNENGAVCKGTDEQLDTYFNVPKGRMKLREGIIENNLIHYLRPDNKKAKASNVLLYKAVGESGALKKVLSAALGVLIEVKKRREIYFIDNVKFHIDEVDGLGGFVEIEAIDSDGSIGQEKLQSQCEFYQKILGIAEKDLVEYSYSDLLFQTRLGNKELLKF